MFQPYFLFRKGGGLNHPPGLTLPDFFGIKLLLPDIFPTKFYFDKKIGKKYLTSNFLTKNLFLPKFLKTICHTIFSTIIFSTKFFIIIVNKLILSSHQ